MKQIVRKTRVAILAGFLLSVLPAKADLGASVMLRHNGVSTFYQWDEVQDAVDDSVDGDTIYLAEGTFSPFNIDKRIMVRGAGPGTIVSGNCTINIPNDKKLDMPVLDALAFTGTLQVNSAGQQLTFRKVKTNILNFATNDFDDVKLESCYITNTFMLAPCVRSMHCDNCKISELRPNNHTSGDLYFTHCNIVNITGVIAAHFYSCAIYSARISGSSTKVLVGCDLNSCVTYPSSESWYRSNTILENCCYYSNSNSSWIDYYNNKAISSLDGTYIGAYGGTYPYTLYPALPTVTKHNVTVDAVNKKLNVTLTLEKK